MKRSFLRDPRLQPPGAGFHLSIFSSQGFLPRILPVLCVFSLAACAHNKGAASPAAEEADLPTPAAADQRIVEASLRIEPEKTYQTIEGFGASAAWWAQDVGGWETEKVQQIAGLLFNPHSGIGLTIYRYNAGGGISSEITDRWRTAETFEVSKGVYDWSRDANAIQMMKAAQAEGAEQFVLFANSPPARMTASGRTTGAKDGSSNLPPEMYTEFAQYLVDVARHLREEEGIPIGWISPLNEPQWDWSAKNGQEGCHYEPEEVLEVTRALIRTIDAAELDVKVSVFESGEWKRSPEYIRRLLDDPEVAPRLEALSIHSYWSTAEDITRVVSFLEGKYPGTKLWQTEWTEMKAGRDTGMDSALVLANTVHEDLTLASVTSWQYWIAASQYTYRDGLIYVNLPSRRIIETKRLWALGNFSRYVRPGDVRVAAQADNKDLQVSAYRAADGARLVVVIIHNGADPVSASLSGLPANLLRATQVETSAQNSLGEVSAGAIPPAFLLPPKSVTTLIFSPAE